MADEPHAKDKVPTLSSTTLFVRNLPFSVDSNDFEKVFSDVGPVKRCFVVKDKDNPGKCRGFGYVTFALKEDAIKAKETVKHINGRKVFLTFSNKKPRHNKKKNDTEENKTEENNNNLVPENADSLFENPKEKLDNDEKTKRKPKSQRADRGGTDGRTVVLSGFLSTANIKQLKKSCKRFGEVEQFIHPVENYENPTAHVVYKSHRGSRIAVRGLNGKTVKSSLLNAVILTKQHKTTTVKSLKKSRLIIRNLSFKCTKQMLMKDFSKFGEISEIVLPTKSVGKSKKKLGFAFVQFKNVFEAAKALEKMNQKEINGRPIAVDWTLPKKKYELLKVDANQEDNVDQHLTRNDEDDEDAGFNHNSDEFDSDQEDSKATEENESDEMLSENDSKKEESEQEESGSEEEEDEKRKKKRKLRDAREGKTIFIRNLPFDANQEEISDLFENFGEVEYCKIVMDDVTEHSRGSAFVKFKGKESAEECLRKCVDDGNETEEITLRSRPLNVTLAVPKGKVAQLLDEKDAAKKSPRDKRNLYLAKEGLITAGSQAAEGLPKSDLQKRLKAEAEKKAKLKIPHYMVSTTRLCFRNLPLNVDNKKLAEILRTVCEGKPKKTGKVQIMRNTDRLDSSGTPRSKGFGFVEFLTHEDALEILRTTNNNPDIFGPDRRPIVEFAIENSLILKRQEQRKARDKHKHELKTQDNVRKNENENKNGRKRKREKKGSKDKNQDSKNLESERPTKKLATDEMVSKPKPIGDQNNKGPKTQTKKRVGKLKRKDTNIAHQTSVDNDKNIVPQRNNPDFSRSKHKRKEQADKEEENFNNIVEKYKNKLFGVDEKQIKKSRWFQ